MNIRPALAIILCGALTCGVQASPIYYSQIGEAPVGQRSSNSNAQTTNNKSDAANAQITVESLDQPEFVRLSDGRLIPYGPGVICSEVCVETDVRETPPGLSRKWLIAIPIAGAAIAAILLTSGETSIPRRTAVGGTSQEPSPTPTPTPGTTPTPTPTPIPNPTPTPLPTPPSDQPHPVPEPGTIGLLGAGLALLSRKRVREFFQRTQK